MIPVLMCTIDDMRLSAMLLPVWVVFLFIAFKLTQKVACFLLSCGEGWGEGNRPHQTRPVSSRHVALRLPGLHVALLNLKRYPFPASGNVTSMLSSSKRTHSV